MGLGFFPLDYETYLTQSDCYSLPLFGILSLIGFSNLSAPSPFSALPPIIFYNASPKAISGRTSYIRVRLEFLRYPHLIHYRLTGVGSVLHVVLPTLQPGHG